MNRAELIYKELSYKICGLAFKVDNEIGCGHAEKVYADAMEELLKAEQIKYQREVYCPIRINGKLLAKKFLDFLVEDKIILELKVSTLKYRESCRQLFDYLKSTDLKLGLIIRFTKDGVKVKRIPNYY